jgi:hypothetical protein
VVTAGSQSVKVPCLPDCVVKCATWADSAVKV